MNTSKAPFSFNSERWALISLFTLGLLVKLPTVFQSLPPFDFCDEGIFSFPILDIIHGKYILSSEFRAGQINIYLGVLANLVAGLFQPVRDVRDVIQNSRILSLAILTPLTGLILYNVVKKVFQSRLQAFLTFIGFVFSPMVLGMSRWHYPDHYNTFFISIFLYFLLASPQSRPLYKNLFWIGLSWALVANVKYSGLFLIAPVFIYCLYEATPRGLKTIFQIRVLLQLAQYMLFVVTIMIFIWVLTNPALFKHWNSFVDWWKFNIENYSGPEGRVFENNYLYYSYLIFFGPLGYLGALAALIGWIQLLRNRPQIAFILISFPVVTIINLGSLEVATARNMLIPVAFVLLLMTHGVKLCIDRFQKKPLLLGFFIVFISFEPLYRLSLIIRSDLQQDARLKARAWIQKNLPSESLIAEVRVCGGAQVLSPDKPEVPFEKAQYFIETSWTSPRYSTGAKTVWNTWNYLDHHFVTRGGLPRQRQELEAYLEKMESFELIEKFYGYGPEVSVFKRKSAH